MYSYDPETTTAAFLNNTFLNTTDPTTAAPHVGKTIGIAIKVVYVIGIFGNAAGIFALRSGEWRVRNRKHLLLLTSLAANDLVALMGMMCAMLVAEYVPGVQQTRAYCAARVGLRVFGIGSVCIAVTMALERYLALTRPFYYQKQVKYYMIRTALLVSWVWAALLTCAPVLGLGLYYDEGAHACVRYRNAREGLHYVYAWFYVAFGTLLCAVLVYCNLAVIRAMYAFASPRAGPAIRRVSRRSARSCRQPDHNAATAEEVAVSVLMAVLSVLFMFCWMPQMVTSALYLMREPATWARLGGLSKASDLLMLCNYVLDPILYVLLRQRRRLSLAGASHSLVNCFKRNHKSSRDSKGSCCLQETVVISDSSGGEMRAMAPPVCDQLLRLQD